MDLVGISPWKPPSRHAQGPGDPRSMALGADQRGLPSLPRKLYRQLPSPTLGVGELVGRPRQVLLIPNVVLL